MENEYGSYGSDMPYKEKIRDIIREHVGTNALLYTADGTYSSLIRDGAVPDTLTTINFGPGTKNFFLTCLVLKVHHQHVGVTYEFE